MFIGADLQEVLESIEKGMEYETKGREVIKAGVHVLPRFFKDTTDRNRTSPFAFTGNKFEFRMLGSSFSIACPNFILNTIIAEELSRYADELERAEDFNTALTALLRRVIKGHKRIIFNGNNYSDEWVEEAGRRGLLNLRTTVDALPHYLDEKNVALFERHKILTREELHSRYEILMENYIKTVNIEALTMLEMGRKDILPAVTGYVRELAETIAAKKSTGLALGCRAEESALLRLSALCDTFSEGLEALEGAVLLARADGDFLREARHYKEKVLPAMEALRAAADDMEAHVDARCWPFPTYGEILFSVL